jgi:hypothetical protein
VATSVSSAKPKTATATVPGLKPSVSTPPATALPWAPWSYETHPQLVLLLVLVLEPP